MEIKYYISDMKVQGIIIMESGGGTEIRRIIFRLTVSVDSSLMQRFILRSGVVLGLWRLQFASLLT